VCVCTSACVSVRCSCEWLLLQQKGEEKRIVAKRLEIVSYPHTCIRQIAYILNALHRVLLLGGFYCPHFCCVCCCGCCCSCQPLFVLPSTPPPNNYYKTPPQKFFQCVAASAAGLLVSVCVLADSSSRLAPTATHLRQPLSCVCRVPLAVLLTPNIGAPMGGSRGVTGDNYPLLLS